MLIERETLDSKEIICNVYEDTCPRNEINFHGRRANYPSEF